MSRRMVIDGEGDPIMPTQNPLMTFTLTTMRESTPPIEVDNMPCRTVLVVTSTDVMTFFTRHMRMISENMTMRNGNRYVEKAGDCGYDDDGGRKGGRENSYE